MNVSHVNAAPGSSWPRWAIGLLAATIVPMGIHELMLSGLGVPYPDSQAVPPFVIGMNNVLSCLALLFALHRTSDTFNRRSLWFQCVCVSLAAAAILETFRVVYMNGLVTSAYVYNALVAIPFVLCRLALFSGVTIVARLPWHALLKALIVVALVVLFGRFEPWLEHALALDMRFASLGHDEVYKPPYGWAVNGPSFVTFLEPVIGLFAAYGVLREKLGATWVKRLLGFVVLVLLFRKPLVAGLVYGVYSPLGYVGFLYAESQFVLEWIAAPALVLLTVEWSGRYLPGVRSIRR